MAMWECPECGLTNAATNSNCEVCAATAPAARVMPPVPPPAAPLTFPPPPSPPPVVRVVPQPPPVVPQPPPVVPPPPPVVSVVPPAPVARVVPPPPPVVPVVPPITGPGRRGNTRVRRRRRAGPGRLAIAICVAVLVVLVVGISLARPWSGSPSDTAQRSESTVPAEETVPGGETVPAGETDARGDGVGATTPAPRLPAAVGLVSLAPTLTVEAVPVAQMFDSYFSAINARDYDAALALYDPAGVVNPSDQRQAAAFAAAVATTRDSDITLWEVGSARDGTVLARVTFRSEQAAGYGPKGNEQQTCTRWDATFTLSQPYPGTYRIMRSRAQNSPC